MIPIVLDYRFVRLFRLLDDLGRKATSLRATECAIHKIYAKENEQTRIYAKYVSLDIDKNVYNITTDIFGGFSAIPGCARLSYLGKRLFGSMMFVSLKKNVKDPLMYMHMGEVFVDIDTHPIKTIPVLVPEDIE